MRKSLFAAAATITILASGSVSAQTTMNGPYYANPSWDQQLPAAQRFIVLSNWNNAAVLDRETGLVWQRTPSADTALWAIASQLCREVGYPGLGPDGGGRLGWRLPSIEELQSLLDLTQSNPTLPAGHPFQQIQSDFTGYWASNIFETDTTARYINRFNDGLSFGGFLTETRAHYWCVRGGPGSTNSFAP